jgi:hypothetical protein
LKWTFVHTYYENIEKQKTTASTPQHIGESYSTVLDVNFNNLDVALSCLESTLSRAPACVCRHDILQMSSYEAPTVHDEAGDSRVGYQTQGLQAEELPERNVEKTGLKAKDKGLTRDEENIPG